VLATTFIFFLKANAPFPLDSKPITALILKMMKGNSVMSLVSIFSWKVLDTSVFNTSRNFLEISLLEI
jgi:hypothetical protein